VLTAKPDLAGRKAAFVAALTAGMTQIEAARSLGVGPRTCRRYYADPQVRAALKAAQDDGLSDIVRRLNSGSQAALAVLLGVMNDAGEPGSVRIRAAQIWLEAAFRARELLDLAARLAVLENIMKENENERIDWPVGAGRSRVGGYS